MNKLMKFLSVAVLSLIALSSTAQQKFGHVDSESLFYAMPEVKTIQTQLQTKSKEYETQLKTLYTQYETIIADIEENGNSYMQAVLEQKYKDAYGLEERIVALEEKAQEELVKLETKLFQPVEQKAYQAIQEVAAANGYTYVLDSSLGVFLVLPEVDDITNLVKSKLGIY
ncbi:OmpH family outer membrane protein [Chitinophagales bacterium]|jgi:outer membrane protein|nr:OmpH family outer membrane protein [Chitinophagales bacterium]|tara:strand:+ start:7657 stop:8166 length:510 start_codon:yes stop_codon:yes gene_type:complete